MTSKEKMKLIEERMHRLHVYEDDLIEKFILGSGSGGQKINKTSSCVYLCHVPTGIEIKCQQERSRALNRYIARMELCERIEKRIQTEKQEKKYLIEKTRRQKRKRSKGEQEKVLKDKSHHSSKKNMRKVSLKGDSE